MIRGILQKGSERTKGLTTSATSTQQQQQPTASSASTSTSTSSSAESTSGSASRIGSRPTSTSEDTTTTGSSSTGGGGNFFRDSTVPIAKSITKSAGKIFRSATTTTTPSSTDRSDSDPPQPNHSQHHHHHPHDSSSSSSNSKTSAPSSSSSRSTTQHQHQYTTSSSHSMLPAATPEPRAGKKCSLCGKNFNPLRRRYFCRVCTVEVCSNCSLKRKVDSSLEGAISIRICMACKMNTSGPQSDFYDRAFSVASALHASGGGTGDDSVFGGDVFGDRTSAASFVSAAAPVVTRGPFNSVTTPSSASTTPAHYTSSKQRAHTPGPVSTGLRRTSSSASTQSAAARARRDSFGSVAAPVECPMCMNEACGPMLELSELQYPAVEARGYADRFLRARSLDNELERLVSVRRIRRVLTETPQTAQRFAQLCSMASIATQSRIAVIALLDRDEAVVVSETGLPVDAAPVTRTLSLAAHTCRNGAPLVCSDLQSDIRFAGNPWRRDTLNVLFYAGIPLTLANGHTIGVIEVFDENVRYACMDVVTQLQAVVRGLLKKFEEILASAPADVVTTTPQQTQQQKKTHQDDESIAAAIAALERTTSYREMKPTSSAPRSPVRRAHAPPTPAPAVVPVVTLEPAVAPVPVPVTPDPAAPTESAPAAPAPAAAGPTENEMELRLMELLSQTTSTQEQLRNQQGQMVHAISSHSKQITELAKQLERIETTLASKLDGVSASTAAKDAAAASKAAESPETVAP